MQLTTASEPCCLLQEVVREAMMNQGFQKRKLKRFAERHATEMGAARLTGTFPTTSVFSQAVMPNWSGQNSTSPFSFSVAVSLSAKPGKVDDLSGLLASKNVLYT